MFFPHAPLLLYFLRFASFRVFKCKICIFSSRWPLRVGDVFIFSSNYCVLDIFSSERWLFVRCEHHSFNVYTTYPPPPHFFFCALWYAHSACRHECHLVWKTVNNKFCFRTFLGHVKCFKTSLIACGENTNGKSQWKNSDLIESQTLVLNRSAWSALSTNASPLPSLHFYLSEEIVSPFHYHCHCHLQCHLPG